MTKQGQHIADLRQRYVKLVARREILQQHVDTLKKAIDKDKQIYQNHVDAAPILLSIGQIHRKVSLERVEQLVTHALQAVFEHNYEFKLRVEEKRGQIEISPIVLDKGMELDPVSSMGGGIVDVISITLRVVSWSMMKDKTDAIIIQDEPARQVNSERYIKNLAELIRRLSRMLNIQFITVTNRPALTCASDRIFEVTQLNGKSHIEVVDGI